MNRVCRCSKVCKSLEDKKEFTPVTDTKSYMTDMFLVVKLDVGCL